MDAKIEKILNLLKDKNSQLASIIEKKVSQKRGSRKPPNGIVDSFSLNNEEDITIQKIDKDGNIIGTYNKEN